MCCLFDLIVQNAKKLILHGLEGLSAEQAALDRSTRQRSGIIVRVKTGDIDWQRRYKRMVRHVPSSSTS